MYFTVSVVQIIQASTFGIRRLNQIILSEATHEANG